MGLLVVLIAVSGLASVLLTRSSRSNSSAVASAEQARLLFVAEAGINLNYLDMEVDPLYVVKDQAQFTWNSTTEEYVSGMLMVRPMPEAKQREYRLSVQYLAADGSSIEFADRTDPVEEFKDLRIRAEARGSQGRKVVTAWYVYHGYAIRGAINNDPVTSLSTSGNGRAVAQAGHVAFTGDDENDEFHVFGDLVTNSKVVYFTDEENTAAASRKEINSLKDADDHFASFDGEVDVELGGTADAIPDFTIPGAAAQMFDFARLEAAATGGAGAVYIGTAAFNNAMSAANAMGEKLEGIIYVKIDPAVTQPDFTVDINITGCLVIDFADGTSPTQKVSFLGALNINAADLTSVVPANKSTYTTGFPGVYADPMKKPSSVDISPVYKNFATNEDLPALLFDNGVIDIHGTANVCGVVYGPAQIEIENQTGLWQYFNGAIYSGGGIWFAGSGGVANSAVMIAWDSATVDRLETNDFGGGRELVRTGYVVSEK